MSLIIRNTAGLRSISTIRNQRHLSESRIIFFRNLVKDGIIRNNMAYSMAFTNDREDFSLASQPCKMMLEQLRISEKQLDHSKTKKYTSPERKTDDYSIAFTGCMLTAIETEQRLSRSLLLGEKMF
mmetsp:Transcript_30648/g.46416  ORF Transcript_30648/g.46416 Transcript_30648/m.46416 type:complete len:126 (+) Transcript_30648:157-534(+)